MEIPELLPAGENEIEMFIKSFEDSELGRVYFPSETSRSSTFNEFLEYGTAYTAFCHGEIIGFLCYLKKGAFHGFPYLHILTVMPEYRGLGHGKTILDIFEKKILKGASKVFLVVADFNPGAKAFYERNGYVRGGYIPSLYREGINENLMMKSL